MIAQFLEEMLALSSFGWESLASKYVSSFWGITSSWFFSVVKAPWGGGVSSDKCITHHVY